MMTRKEAHKAISSAKQRIAQSGRGLLPTRPDARDYDLIATAYDTLAESSSAPEYERRKAAEAREDAAGIRCAWEHIDSRRRSLTA